MLVLAVPGLIFVTVQLVLMHASWFPKEAGSKGVFLLRKQITFHGFVVGFLVTVCAFVCMLFF